MAFCGKCGTQLDGSERFCVKCGAPVAANGAAAPAPAVQTPVVAAPAAPAQGPVMAAPAVPGQAAPPFAAPGPYAPGPIPIAMGAPPAPAKRGGWLWGLVIAGVVLYGLYYLGTHNQQTGGTGTTPTQPGAATQPGATPTTGAAPQPGVAVQPGDPGPGGSNAALVGLQDVSGDWRALNGSLQEYNVKWVNRSTVTIQSSVLECDQYDANNEVLAQNRTNLNGPLQPGGTGTYNPFNMGTVQQGLNSVNCGIVAVTPAQ